MKRTAIQSEDRRMEFWQNHISRFGYEINPSRGREEAKRYKILSGLNVLVCCGNCKQALEFKTETVFECSLVPLTWIYPLDIKTGSTRIGAHY